MAGVGHAHVLGGDGAGPPAHGDAGGDEPAYLGFVQVQLQHQIGQPGPQRAHRAGGHARQARAKAQCDEVRRMEPDVIINCTGITDTDECEKNPEHAYRVNALGARNLSIVARKCGAKIVQLSTDDVFDGKSKKPYTEFDDTNPLTVYGRSKRAGENYVKEFTHKHFIIRSNWVYGKGGNNFVNRVLETAEKGQALSVASDQFGSPTSAKDLARMILYLIDTNEYGTYHVTCSGVCNRYEFATEILRLAGKEIELRSVPTEQSDLSSVRPPYAVLDNFILRIIEVYDMPDWKASLKEYMDERAED